MRRVRFAILAAILAVFLVPFAGAISMTINTSEAQAHIGDVVTLSGTVTGIKTIAIYLSLTGPGLSPGGVTLENLNVPTGRGLYTTAPVDLSTGNWRYDWDTAVILGDLKPGKYKVYASYALSSSIDKLVNPDIDYASTEIEFLPSEIPTNEVSVPPIIPLAAILFVIMIFYLGRLNESSLKELPEKKEN